MINAFDIFENATDYDKELFMTSLDQRLLDIPRFFDTASRRVKEREKVIALKEKINAGVYGFSYEQLADFYEIFRLYGTISDTYVDIDKAAEEKLWMTCKKYTRLIDDLLSQHRT